MSRGQGRHPERLLSTFELIFVTKDSLSICEEGEHFEVTAGESLLLWPRFRHWGAGPYSKEVCFYWLHFELEESDVLGGVCVPKHARVARPDHLTSLFRRFLDDQQSGILSPLKAALLTVQMLLEIAELSPSVALKAEIDNGLVNRVRRLIRTHYHEKLTTSSIAEALHRNPDYLGRVFREVTGLTITEAIHRYRIKKARSLLLETELDVEEIAVNCGFKDIGYFGRVFKRYEGVSPQRFKQLYAKLHVNTG